MEEKSAQPNFWDNAQEAGGFLKKLTQLKEDVATWRGLEKRLDSSLELADLGIAEKDASLVKELQEEVADIAARTCKSRASPVRSCEVRAEGKSAGIW